MKLESKEKQEYREKLVLREFRVKLGSKERQEFRGRQV